MNINTCIFITLLMVIKRSPRFFERPAFDFWVIFGKYDIFFAIIPFALVLAYIATSSFIKSKEEKRLIFTGYLSVLMFFVFISYLFVFYYWKKGYHASNGCSIVSIYYPMLIFLCELLIALSLLPFLLLILSFFIDTTKINSLPKFLNRTFPYFCSIVVLLSVFLNMRYPLDPLHTPRIEGIFKMIFRLAKSSLSLELFVLPLLLFFYGIIRFQYLNHRETLRISFTMIISAVIVFLAYYIEMFVHWRDGMPILSRTTEYHYHYFTNITIMHLVFGLLVISWLCVNRFHNPFFDNIFKKAAIGAILGFIAALIFFPRYIMYESIVT